MVWIRALFVALILSGIAGVVVGDTSAAAGWRLIVVFSALLLAGGGWIGGLRRLAVLGEPRADAPC